MSGSERFPFNNFTCYLTLFSKCFSSFDHSTCALSVSSRYLALEGVYLPLEQHSQTTRLVEGASHGLGVLPDGALTLYGVPFQGTRKEPVPEASSANYNSGPEGARFQI
jgi:hypothetical protein